MKIRLNYVSNSSSSSFILNNDELIEIFHERGFRYCKAYKISDIKKAYLEAIDFIKNNKNDMNNYEYDDIYNCFIKDKAPEWMEYYFMIDISNPDIDEVLESLDDNKYITDAMDRDDLYNAFFGNVNEQGVELFDSDL